MPKSSILIPSPNVIPTDHVGRLQQIIDVSWKVFQSHFINGRYLILKEAPFQHHFANIISTVGSLYCMSQDDRFLVNLEAKCQIGTRSKFLDITCSFNKEVKCAIELKFKTAQQGAQDHGRIDAYVDIAALEGACQGEYNFGRFYMITDSSVYINQSVRGVGTRFCMHHGYRLLPNLQLKGECKGREDVEVRLEGVYQFNWTKFDKWYFLELKIREDK